MLQRHTHIVYNNRQSEIVVKMQVLVNSSDLKQFASHAKSARFADFEKLYLIVEFTRNEEEEKYRNGL